jgi:formylmethanofuran dehydrogenase subunit C
VSSDRTMSSNGMTVNFNNTVGTVIPIQQNDGTIIVTNNSQDLERKELATEIVKLIEELQEELLAEDEAGQIAIIDKKITPTLKTRIIAAVKAFGESCLDEFILENKYLKVVKALIKGWFDTDR